MKRAIPTQKQVCIHRPGRIFSQDYVFSLIEKKGGRATYREICELVARDGFADASQHHLGQRLNYLVRWQRIRRVKAGVFEVVKNNNSIIV